MLVAISTVLLVKEQVSVLLFPWRYHFTAICRKTCRFCNENIIFLCTNRHLGCNNFSFICNKKVSYVRCRYLAYVYMYTAIIQFRHILVSRSQLASINPAKLGFSEISLFVSPNDLRLHREPRAVRNKYIYEYILVVIRPCKQTKFSFAFSPQSTLIYSSFLISYTVKESANVSKSMTSDHILTNPRDVVGRNFQLTPYKCHISFVNIRKGRTGGLVFNLFTLRMTVNVEMRRNNESINIKGTSFSIVASIHFANSRLEITKSGLKARLRYDT